MDMIIAPHHFRVLKSKDLHGTAMPRFPQLELQKLIQESLDPRIEQTSIIIHTNKAMSLNHKFQRAKVNRGAFWSLYHKYLAWEIYPYSLGLVHE